MCHLSTSFCAWVPGTADLSGPPPPVHMLGPQPAPHRSRKGCHQIRPPAFHTPTQSCLLLSHASPPAFAVPGPTELSPPEHLVAATLLPWPLPCVALTTGTPSCLLSQENHPSPLANLSPRLPPSSHSLRQTLDADPDIPSLLGSRQGRQARETQPLSPHYNVASALTTCRYTSQGHLRAC